MTIEISPPAHQPAKASSAPSKAGKGAGETGHEAAATGFLAILGALADAAPQDAAPGMAATDAPMDTAQSALPFDAAALLQQNPQIAAAQAAASASPDSLEGAAADALAQGGGRSNAMAGRSRMLAGSDAGKPAADALWASDSATLGLQRAGAHGNKVAKDKSALAANDTGTPINAATLATERMEVKDSKLLAAIEQARASVAARSAEPTLVTSLAMSEKSPGERMAQAMRSAEPTYGGSALEVGSPEFSQSVAPSEVPPETQVAEQVTYWVSQNVQNAELQLDGLGQSPVEVSIQVQGNEAHITFRTDEAQTRGVLEGAGAQLKDMLQREGVLLSGVSVGTSGGGDASGSGGDRRGRPQVRQVTMAPLEAAAAPSARRAGQDAGQSVDLFV
jgi:flagellar hook-length control protein FliK